MALVDTVIKKQEIKKIKIHIGYTSVSLSLFSGGNNEYWRHEGTHQHGRYCQEDWINHTNRPVEDYWPINLAVQGIQKISCRIIWGYNIMPNSCR